MTTTPAPPPPAPYAPPTWPGPKLRERSTVIVLTLCIILIAYTVGWGNPQNALHVAAQLNAFVLIGVVMGALGAPVIVEHLRK